MTVFLAVVLVLVCVLGALDWLDGPHPPPPEFDDDTRDLRSLQRSIDQRAALRRATRERRTP